DRPQGPAGACRWCRPRLRREAVAQGIRSRHQAVTPPAVRPFAPRARLLLPLIWPLLVAACTRAAATANADAAPDVDVGTLAADAVVAAVLANCHDGLPGMDRVAVTATLADAQLQAFAALPSRLRVQPAGGALQLLVGDRALEV